MAGSTERTICEHPHRRYNPLKDEWLLVAPQRCQRPWLGQTERGEVEAKSELGSNPLCPGATRSSGLLTPDYDSTFVFTNDFPALLPDAPDPGASDDPLFRTASAQGTCRVMCFHPSSNAQLATMKREEVLQVVETWIGQTRDLAKDYDWVQIFENKGEVMGCSNPHPHCQIWASRFLPNEPATKHRTQAAYLEKFGRVMLLDYVEKELTKRERVVAENASWVVVVPFWAVWPYETLLLPKRHVLRLPDLNPAERGDLCEIMRVLLVKYDNLFQTAFPYSMGWHGAPTGGFLTTDCGHWLLHAVYLPPLLRSASVKKFMAGFEMICEPQRDLTPETAAETLRNLPTVHFSHS